MPRQRKPNDLSRSLIALDMDKTLIAVVELSLSSWLVAGIVPGVERQPLKKLKTDENALLTLLNRWRDEAVRSGHKISRIAVAFEAGRDGFWLARWLKAWGIEAHVIHASRQRALFQPATVLLQRLEKWRRAELGNFRGRASCVKAVSIFVDCCTGSSVARRRPDSQSRSRGARGPCDRAASSPAGKSSSNAGNRAMFTATRCASSSVRAFASTASASFGRP